MKSFAPFRLSALLVFGAAALFAACGGPSSIGAPSVDAMAGKPAHEHMFHFTGKEQSFKVPTGVTQVTVTVNGAAGQPGYDFGMGSYSSPGGLGGRVKATIPVTSGETLAIFVGGSGGDGGFNGGCAGGGKNNTWGIGGGASDVRQRGDTLADRVLVSGGGGGGGTASYCLASCGYGDGGAGGSGGGANGGVGDTGAGGASGFGGGGGSAKKGGFGGAGWTSGCAGSHGKSGVGGNSNDDFRDCGANGGGGGGGYYGGGGAGSGGYYQSGSGYSGPGGGGGGARRLSRARRRTFR